MVINGLEDYTFAAWIKTEGSGIIIAKANSGCADLGRDPNHDPGTKQFGVMPDGRLTSTANGLYSLESATTVNDGEWHHVAVTVDRDVAFGNERLPQTSFYIDGVLDWQSDVTRGIRSALLRRRLAPNVEGIFAVGRGTFQSNRTVGAEDDRNRTHFIGSIDDLWVFEGALAPEEIASLADGEQVDCGQVSDTFATEIVVSPPADGYPGPVAVSVEATDASGDAVWYIYRAHRLEGGVATLPSDSLGFPLAYGPTTSPNVRVELPGGTWWITCRGGGRSSR